MVQVISFTIIRQPMWVVDYNYGQKFANGVPRTFFFAKMGSTDIFICQKGSTK